MDLKPVIAYGFEYDKQIKYTKNLILCQSITTGNPVYCSIIIEDTIDILKKMENIEQTQQQKMKEINEYRNIRFAEHSTCWQIVLYGSNLKFELEEEEQANNLTCPIIY